MSDTRHVLLSRWVKKLGVNSVVSRGGDITCVKCAIDSGEISTNMKCRNVGRKPMRMRDGKADGERGFFPRGT